eukprot:TRINITY_DN10972_c0_g1_i1.p1 TRINITY_DN10972_c0_g1~~TRINITY_DN10972_c0_g1_i1.p1  ORF type:complete len:540 (-),score=153.21 TRINITY_DN10972_c0_g1_i1:44-1615(-)
MLAHQRLRFASAAVSCHFAAPTCRRCSSHARGPGVLYVVATPIGNIDDLSQRAASVLRNVPVIAAESVHTVEALVASLRSAATPSASSSSSSSSRARAEDEEVSEAWREQVEAFLAANRFDDKAVWAFREEAPHIQAAAMNKGRFDACRNPSAELVARLRKARKLAVGTKEHRVVSYHSHNESERVPGPCSAAAALSVSGLRGDRLLFEGYMPALRQLRLARLRHLCSEASGAEVAAATTVAIFSDGESLHELLADACAVFGAAAAGCVARALTTPHEQVISAPLGLLCERWAQVQPEQRRGAVVFLAELPLGPSAAELSSSSSTAAPAESSAAEAEAAQEREVARVVKVLAGSGVPQHRIALLAMQLCGSSMAVALRASQRILLGDGPPADAPGDGAGASGVSSGSAAVAAPLPAADGASAPPPPPSQSAGGGAGPLRTLHLRNLGPHATAEAVSVALERAGVRRVFVKVFENHIGEKVAFARFATPEQAASARVSINLAGIDLNAGRPLSASWANRERWIA